MQRLHRDAGRDVHNLLIILLFLKIMRLPHPLVDLPVITACYKKTGHFRPCKPLPNSKDIKKISKFPNSLEKNSPGFRQGTRLQGEQAGKCDTAKLLRQASGLFTTLSTLPKAGAVAVHPAENLRARSTLSKDWRFLSL